MIESERLILRPPLAGDFEAFAAMFADAGVTRHIGGVQARSDAWARFLRDCGHWALEGFGQFTILERASGAYVGKTGLAKFERDLGPKAATAVEITWTLQAAFHGRGYAREAAALALGHFDRTVGGRSACLIAEGNDASQRLAERLGYREVDRLERGGTLVALLVRDSAPAA
ncbi:GNAT family N-acetyltransferase [Salipiger sp. H15]|uniref:GNAT family N-acetyltransferase n=1 Tax=Alloyangia sp. H15 TaxID=3029062 RepID=A0AAU8AD56_9RHOB